MAHFFITGTDTEIGKTYVTCRLLEDLRRRGIRACGYKPVACGDREDARAMQAAAGGEPEIDLINPLYLRAATAPYIAATLESREISMDSLLKGFQVLSSRFESVLVEGAGGWEAPIAPGITMANLAQALQLPIVVVVGNKLGAVNHAVMTVKLIRAAGLECRAIVLNRSEDAWDTASVTNRKLIEEFTASSVAAELIHGQDDIDSRAVLQF